MSQPTSTGGTPTGELSRSGSAFYALNHQAHVEDGPPVPTEDDGHDSVLLRRERFHEPCRHGPATTLAVLVALLGTALLTFPSIYDSPERRVTSPDREIVQTSGGIVIGLSIPLVLRIIHQCSPRRLSPVQIFMGVALVGGGIAILRATDNSDLGRLDTMGYISLAAISTGLLLIGSGMGRACFRA